MNISEFTGIPISGAKLRAALSGYKNPSKKVERLAATGEILRLRRDLYVGVGGGPINTYLAANYIVSPSYVSGLTALSYYGIIPEFVCDVISMTTKKAVTHVNYFGEFCYHLCPRDYYSIGIHTEYNNGNPFVMAGVEKALCDHIFITPKLNLRFKRDVLLWLEEDMRMDMDELAKMDFSIIEKCAELGRKKTMLNNIIRVLR